MKRVLFDTHQPVTALGAGPVSDAQLAAALTIAPTIVAADGGAERARRAGRPVAMIVGDLDSLVNADSWREQGTPVHHIADQDTTDFEKCLAAIRAPLILGAGFTGGRLDHELAAFSALIAEGTRPVILIGEEDIVFHCPGLLALDLAPGTRVSLFPFAPVSGTSTGLRWPIDGLAFAPGGRIGTSNAATGPVDITAGPGLLVLLPVETLAQVARVLSTPAR